MTQYEEIKILEARGLRELAIDLRHQPKEVITEEQAEIEKITELLREE